MRDHENVCVMPIKVAEIDTKIVPVVGWLNTYEDVYTLYSCEGGENEEPYVMFICNSMTILNEIVNISNRFYDEINTEVYSFMGTMRFIMRFETTDILKSFCDYLLENYVEIKELG